MVDDRIVKMIGPQTEIPLRIFEDYYGIEPFRKIAIELVREIEERRMRRHAGTTSLLFLNQGGN